MLTGTGDASSAPLKLRQLASDRQRHIAARRSVMRKLLVTCASLALPPRPLVGSPDSPLMQALLPRIDVWTSNSVEAL